MLPTKYFSKIMGSYKTIELILKSCNTTANIKLSLFNIDLLQADKVLETICLNSFIEALYLEHMLAAMLQRKAGEMEGREARNTSRLAAKDEMMKKYFNKYLNIIKDTRSF